MHGGRLHHYKADITLGDVAQLNNQKSMYVIILTKRINSQRKSICQNPTSISNKNFQKTSNRS